MKKLLNTISVLGLVAVASTNVTFASEIESVTGAAEGVFTANAQLGAVAIDSLDVGTGVFIDPDGSASGTFHAVLAGHSILGPREITVEGKVIAGVGESSGAASFSGTATVDLGDGAPALPGVPFIVTVTANTVVLALDSTPLPAAALTAGAIAIE